MFSPPQFITIGDEYDKKDGIPERYKGRSLLSAPGKKGHGADCTFTKKFQSLSEGDKYVDPGYYEKRYRLENEKKKITPQGFKYTSGSKRPNGSGTYFGTFNETAPVKHEPEYDLSKKDAAAKKPTPPNIVTNPPKKGTFGYAGVTIGHGDETKYVSDPYDGEKRKEAMKAKEASKRLVGPPFKAACKRGDFFDSTAHGVSKVYSINGPLPAKKQTVEEKKPPLKNSWKPAGALVSSITKPPEYVEDPYEAKEKAQREARKANQPKTTWKPIGGSKSLPTRAIKFTPA